jgi:pimeloyl-ACP methyl ester carboxylesterase
MEVLDAIKEQNNNNKFNLIAYSGGGTIALMLGANREDIQSIRTIGGNLDHNELSKITKTSPLTNSIAAKEFIFKTEKIPQIHYYGEKDKVIPEKIFLDYKNSFSNQNCITVKKIELLNHYDGWDSFWKSNVKKAPICMG